MYDIGNLRVTQNSNNWEEGSGNCINFDKSENSRCVPVGEVWYREVPNQTGTPEVHDPDTDFSFLSIIGWVIAGLILLGIICLLVKLLTASAKPGMGSGAQADYYENGGTSRGVRQIEEEQTTIQRGSTRRGLTQYEDVEEVQYSNNGVSQEEMYGDYSSMPYRESKVVYG